MIISGLLSLYVYLCSLRTLMGCVALTCTHSYHTNGQTIHFHYLPKYLWVYFVLIFLILMCWYAFVLCSFIDLPNLSLAVYSTELCSRLRAFLVACPPPGPASYVTELLVATADFQKDLTTWNIKYFHSHVIVTDSVTQLLSYMTEPLFLRPVKGGVDAKELFHLYIILWIQDKRLSLLESCKLDKVYYIDACLSVCSLCVHHICLHTWNALKLILYQLSSYCLYKWTLSNDNLNLCRSFPIISMTLMLN